MTSSKKYFGENGSARPATRLMAISAKPRSSSPLRGFSRARISGSAFQVSAADFFGLPDGVVAPAPAERGDALSEWPMRVVLPGSFGTMFFRCSELSYDYISAACNRRPFLGSALLHCRLARLSR